MYLGPQKSENRVLHQSKYFECDMKFDNSDYIFINLIKYVV